MSVEGQKGVLISLPYAIEPVDHWSLCRMATGQYDARPSQP